MRQLGIGIIPVIGMLAAAPAQAARLSERSVNEARFTRTVGAVKGAHPVVLKAQVLLDRAFFSPGAIDATYGSNVKKALKAFQGAKKLKVTGVVDRATWTALKGDQFGEALIRHKITQNDVNGPFVAKIPTDIRNQAKMKRMSYISAREQLAERFHMSEALLAALNPGVNFKKPGASILVANVGGRKPTGTVASLVVDKRAQTVKAYDKAGKILAFYPATVGSGDFPSPKGKVKVTAVAPEPTFTLTSKVDYARKKLKAGEKLVVAPGPNNPVGIVWINLSKPKYGIHGTPEPTKISKTASHGCVRLTNWDAQDLAGLVRKGVPVVFG